MAKKKAPPPRKASRGKALARAVRNVPPGLLAGAAAPPAPGAMAGPGGPPPGMKRGGKVKSKKK